MRRRAPVLVLLLAIGAGASWLLLRTDGSDTAIVAAGTVEARESDLGFRTAGRIELVSVDEGDRISETQLLAVLDHRELAAALAAASAYLEIVRAIFLKGAGPVVLWPQFAALLILGTAGIAVAIRRFARSIA